MGLADRPPQTVLRLRNCNQMDVIGHQAVRPNLDPAFSAPVGHQLHVRRVVRVVEERLLPTISTLGYVMWQTRNH